MCDIVDIFGNISHNEPQFEIMKTSEFERWYQELKDSKTKERILAKEYYDGIDSI